MNKKKRPLRLLRRFCRPDLLEELEGDLMEMYESQKAERGAKKAIRWLWWEVVKLFRPGIVRSLEGTYSLTNYGMLKSHLKSSTRIIWRQKFYSVIIVLSLALGLSFSTVFVTYLSQQSRVDNFHPNKDRLFRLLGDDPFDESRKISFVMDKTSEYLISNYPAIRAICRLNAPDQIAIVHNGNVFDDKVLLAVDSSFFWMFGFELMHGNRKNALTKNGIVISDQLSALLFGDENPISKTIRVQTDSIERPLNVTGVFRQGENSHLRFDALLYYPDFASRYAGSPTYVLLQDKAASTPLEGLFAEDKNVPGLLGPGSSSYYLQPLKDIYFDTANTRTFSFAISGRFIWTAWIVMVLILVIAGFNFINLFLLFSIKRQKELGIKTILGVGRKNLMLAVMTDVFLFISFSYLLSLVLIHLFLGEFNRVMETNIQIADVFSQEGLATFVTVLLVLGGIASLFIATRISAFQPVRMIATKGPMKLKVNKYLVTPQFIIAITLSICSLAIMQQMDYIRTKPLGFNRNLIEIDAGENGEGHRLGLLKESLKSSPLIENVCLSSGNPISGNMMVHYELENGEMINTYLFSGDEDMIRTFGLTLVPSDGLPQNGCFVNETLVRAFGLKDPVGKSLPNATEKIAGIVHDFNMVSFRQEIPPVIITIGNGEYTKILVDYTGKPLPRVLHAVREEWEKIFPDHVFRYKLIENELERKHLEDVRLLQMVRSFAVACMLIACFGLFALAWGTIQNRTREVGIRKVFGATLSDILRLLSVDFMKWVVLAFVISSPIAYYLMDDWLRNFSYRESIGMGPFLKTGLLALVISWLMVGFHAVKAAILSPADTIREE